MPAAVLHGEQSGRTMLITAGVHSGEYVGIQAAIELSQKLKIEKVTGTVIIVKVMNRTAFEKRGGSLGYADQKDLNRVFPRKRGRHGNRETCLDGCEGIAAGRGLLYRSSQRRRL